MYLSKQPRWYKWPQNNRSAYMLLLMSVTMFWKKTLVTHKKTKCLTAQYCDTHRWITRQGLLAAYWTNFHRIAFRTILDQKFEDFFNVGAWLKLRHSVVTG